jgi:UDP-N-acetylglucosamine diphosphorylase / glucose-1-phosphate thymidylyltransferase / UDP-N-acetylgalactosamine diphosphorylase / glucosamine-1-phosphate N-acetyltransferase / galactosamine-1-phosphate N-acetyltransferase
MKIQNILILAGGDSTRFWPLEEKNLLSFLGKPLILHQIEQLTKFSDKITVIVSKQNHSLINRLIDKNIQLIQQDDKFPGSGGAVLSAKNKISGEVLILNAADVLNYDILT